MFSVYDFWLFPRAKVNVESDVSPHNLAEPVCPFKHFLILILLFIFLESRHGFMAKRLSPGWVPPLKSFTDWDHLLLLAGTGCEMYTETLSPSFTGMSFSQASELCFIKLKLLLLAIEVKSEEAGGDPKICINPHMSKIPANSVGFFITQSAEEAKRWSSVLASLSLMLTWCRAWFYCKACHENVKDENLIKKCKCKHCKYPILLRQELEPEILFPDIFWQRKESLGLVVGFVSFH